eukprot:15365505-Ditylum_brightwellii.AAC.1
MSYKIYTYIKEETVPHLFATCTTCIHPHTLVNYISKAATFVLSAHHHHFHLRILLDYVSKAATFTANQPTLRQTITTIGRCSTKGTLWDRTPTVEMTEVVEMVCVEQSEQSNRGLEPSLNVGLSC